MMKHIAFILTTATGLWACSGDVPTPRSTIASTSSTSADVLGEAGVDARLADENIKFSGDAKTQIKKYQDLIAQRSPELSFLRNSEDKLSKMILLNSERGCMLSQNIKSIELSIGGGVQGSRDRGRHGDQKSSKGSPDDIVVEFGSGMSITMDGNGFFRNKNHSTDRLSSYKIADLDKVKFIKDGIKYSNKRHCRRVGGFLGIGSREECEYEVKEENIWFLSDLNIKVNGVLMYDKGGINKTFDGNRSEWEDGNIKSNRAYIEMLGKVDCE